MDISPAALLDRIKSGTAPTILDVRSGWEYKGGHVPGAIHLPFWTLETRISEVPASHDDPIIVYCGYGPRAWMAGAVLRRHGFSNVMYLDGHMHGWKQAGLPLLMLLIGIASGSGQTAPVAGSTTLDRIVSPRVVSTYVIRGNRVALLVLWRGSPGWFKKASDGGDSASVASGGFYEQDLSIAAGGLKLRVAINHTAFTAQILGREIQLTASDVVLVDNVDSLSGPQIADVLWIEPTLRTDRDPLSTLLAGAPQLVDFLQCDAVFSNPRVLSGFSTACHQLVGR